MAVDPSAYAVLGLEPSADVPTIERAYRKLIKEHHPDRGGEDSSRAAEIIEAYRAIRAERHLKDPLELNEHWLEEGQGSRAWVAFAGLLALATVFLLLTQGPLAPLTEGIASPGIGAARKADPGISGGMDQPLHTKAIDNAVRDALTLARTSDEIGLAKESRDCHHLLRMSPSVVQLDRCAAFDDAVVQLQDRDPLRDQGPFSELAVTGRNWSGATALSDDAVAIDNRLDRIRLRVEFALAPVVQSGPPPPRKD